MATVSTGAASNELGQTRTASVVGQIGLAVAATIFIALCAHVSLPLPWTPVPLTLQDFAVLLIALAMAPRAAFAALLLYLVEGAAGLPVFNPHGPGGIAQLVGPTGGFLMSYPFAAVLASSITRRTRDVSARLLAGVAFNIILFTVGASWLAVLTHPPLRVLLAAAVLPFLPGAVLKIASAAGLISAWHKLRFS